LRNQHGRTPVEMPMRETLWREYFEEGKTYKEISELHGNVALSTVSKWFKHYDIDPRWKYKTVMLGGKPHRRCFGPSHPPEGEILPYEKFWKNAGKRNGLQGFCVECLNGAQRVKFQPTYQMWVESIYRRLGYMETTRRLGISEKTLTIWRGKHKQREAPLTIRRSNAKKIVQVLHELKLTNEVRHRKSIHRGSAVRGEKERKVTSVNDLLVKTTHDAENEYRRRRRKNPEIAQRERELQNASRRRKREKEQERLTDAA
jgi:hypothetical protein